MCICARACARASVCAIPSLTTSWLGSTWELGLWIGTWATEQAHRGPRKWLCLGFKGRPVLLLGPPESLECVQQQDLAFSI